MKRSLQNTLQPLFGIMLAVMGLFVVAVGIGMIHDGGESADWPTVTGEITSTAIEHRVSNGGTSATSTDNYYANLKYAYEYKGISREGSRYHIGGSRKFGSRSGAESFLMQYPVGTNVTVFVHPDTPDWAVLSTGVPATAWLITGLGAAFLLTAGVLLVQWVRSWSKRADARAAA